MRGFHEQTWPDVLKRAVAAIKPVVTATSTERRTQDGLQYEQAVVSATYGQPNTRVSRGVLLNVDLWATNSKGGFDYGRAFTLSQQIKTAIEGDLGGGIMEARLTSGPNRERDTAPLPDYLTLTFTLDVSTI